MFGFIGGFIDCALGKSGRIIKAQQKRINTQQQQMESKQKVNNDLNSNNKRLASQLIANNSWLEIEKKDIEIQKQKNRADAIEIENRFKDLLKEQKKPIMENHNNDIPKKKKNSRPTLEVEE